MAEKYGDTLAQKVAKRLAPPAATTLAIEAITASDRVDGMLVACIDDDTLWQFSAGSSATAGATVLEPDAGTGRWLKVGDSSAAGVYKLAATIGHADLDAAATTQTKNVGSALPANARILGTNVKLGTAFSGGTVSALVMTLGSSGDADALIASSNLFDAAVDGLASTKTAGLAPNKHFAASTQLTALFTATGDNLVNLTAGAVTIEVLYTILA
jgi:hypothetical protein